MRTNRSLSKFHAATLLKDNIHDITLYSWIFDGIERGIGYDLKKSLHIWCKCLIFDCCQCFGTFMKFLNAIISSIMDFVDLFKDLSLVLILWHLSTRILVRAQTISNLMFVITVCIESYLVLK